MVTINREHKDRLFKMIFGRPEHRQWTLSLYNAVNGTSYDDPEQIEFNTMDDVLYMGMKNDLSFILDAWLSIYGHQSTFNPNMPVRCLFYLSWLWSKHLVGGDKVSIYGKRLIKLPVPKFVVFYNGTDEEPDEQILHLSASFPENRREQSDVELKVRMVNINHDHNAELLERCRPLYEYSWLIGKIREYALTIPIEKAVDRALEEMPEGFGIRKYLMENREEVCMKILTEYDEEKTMRILAEQAREDGFEEGREEGREEGEDHHLVELICKKLRRGKDVEQIADEVEEDLTRVSRICDVAERFSPDYDLDEVFKAVEEEVLADSVV
ncbi:MAG: hypothetical protein IJM34_07890 [Lachnospiraceae bacterium]|nr:hypothetical protein [Lachnospiraceae bacterium]